jgi:hypothetical protein
MYMKDDKTPKEFLQTKLFELNQDTDKAIEAHYTAIGKIAYARDNNSENSKSQLVTERELIRWFEGQKHGLNMASDQVRQIIPDENRLEKLGVQLANWVHNSGFTKKEFDELKQLADKIIGEA